MSTSEEASVPQFILKLYEMIQSYPHIISFSLNGKQVLIHSYQKFVSSVLPCYFRHKNWRSFVRQMNMGLEVYMFVNQIFQQGNEQNYHLIKRKEISKNDQKFQQIDINKSLQYWINQEYGSLSLSNFIYQITQFQDKAEKACKQLKKTLQVINNLKKSPLTKSCASRVKDSTQTISESTKKFKQNLKAQQQYYSLFPIARIPFKKHQKNIDCQSASQRQLLKNNLLMPKPISSKHNPQVSDNYINTESKSSVPSSIIKKQTKKSQNKLVISALCSFNSFNSLDRFVTL